MSNVGVASPSISENIDPSNPKVVDEMMEELVTMIMDDDPVKFIVFYLLI